jgi:4a-hydroxytetrahydrobiopterin dehydratase
MTKLTEPEIQKNLRQLTGWTVAGNVLKKEFEFKDFSSAMVFMNAVGRAAERLNHHPDWSNSYNKVSMNLTSHSESGLTQKDFDLAAAADTASKN